MMNEPYRKNSLRWLKRIVFACIAFASAGLAPAATPVANSDAPLRAKYAELVDQLYNNQFHRTIYLESAESSRDLRGDIYALVDYPFADVKTTLNGPAHWCDVLI